MQVFGKGQNGLHLRNRYWYIEKYGETNGVSTEGVFHQKKGCWRTLKSLNLCNIFRNTAGNPLGNGSTRHIIRADWKLTGLSLCSYKKT